MRYGLKHPDGRVTDILRSPHREVPEGFTQVAFEYPEGYAREPLREVDGAVVVDTAAISQEAEDEETFREAWNDAILAALDKRQQRGSATKESVDRIKRKIGR